MIGSAYVHPEKVPHDDLRAIGSLIRQSMSHSVSDSPLRSALTGNEVSRCDLKAQLPDGGLEELCACGLLVESAQRVSSPFRAHLVERFVVVTDPEVPENIQDRLYLDPLWEAPRLVKLLIRQVVGLGLDMGCGSGVFSLVMSSFCEQVIGVDISPRAIALSRFNSALNGVRNVTFIESDLFDSVRGQQFDLIVFNSPTDEEGYEFVDLLECGEQLLAKFFADIGDHLKPNGYCQINFAMNDYADSRFSDRLATWINAKKQDLRWVTMVRKRHQREKGGMWKRGWATFCRGSYFSSEVGWPYYLLADSSSPRELSQLILRLLENHELLNFRKDITQLTWSEGLCCIPPGRQTVGLWDAPLAQIPEDILLLLGSKLPLSFPTGSRLDFWIELCLRKGLLRVAHDVSIANLENLGTGRV